LGLQETTEAGPLGALSLFGVAERLLAHVRDVVPKFEQFFD
jgi:hypothetical protein